MKNLFIILLMAGSLSFAACGGSKTEEASATEEVQEAPAVEEAAADSTKLEEAAPEAN